MPSLTSLPICPKIKDFHGGSKTRYYYLMGLELYSAHSDLARQINKQGHVGIKYGIIPTKTKVPV
jgi:hypothetical protein